MATETPAPIDLPSADIVSDAAAAEADSPAETETEAAGSQPSDTPEPPAADAVQAGPDVAREGTDAGPRFSRALLALVAAATLAVAPIATSAVGPAGSGASAHSSPAYVLAQAAHDIGHNDWAFQGGLYGRIAWVVSYLALGLFWLLVALWIRTRVRRAKLDRADPGRRLWIKVLTAAWAAETVTGCLTLGGGLYVDWNSSTLGPVVLKASDVCSPWMSCVAALLVVGFAEHRPTGLRSPVPDGAAPRSLALHPLSPRVPAIRPPAFYGAALYAAVLALILLVPVPGPDALKIIILAAAAAVPALLESDPSAQADPDPFDPDSFDPGPTPAVTPPAVAAG
jgi:hypothetical protein